MNEKLDWLDERLNRIEDKADTLNQRQLQMQAVLEDHQRRSIALEARVEQVQSELSPLKQSAANWAWAGKLIVGIGGLATAATLVLRLLGVLS